MTLELNDTIDNGPLTLTNPAGKPKYFGAFELFEKIGRGNTSVVFKAQHRTSSDIVALKIGVPLVSLDQVSFERFRREFTIIRYITHPHLVQVLKFGEFRGFPFLVQEF